MKKIFYLFVIFGFYSLFNAQQKFDIKIKKIKELEKSFVFKIKNLKTKEISYFFSYKKDSTCNNKVKIQKNKQYELLFYEINIPYQNDGNKFNVGIDDFRIPNNHKLYYSENIKGLYICE